MAFYKLLRDLSVTTITRSFTVSHGTSSWATTQNQKSLSDQSLLQIACFLSTGTLRKKVRKSIHSRIPILIEDDDFCEAKVKKIFGRLLNSLFRSFPRRKSWYTHKKWRKNLRIIPERQGIHIVVGGNIANMST